MRKNSMTKCAVSAMLFGGTIGLSQAASAGVVTFFGGPLGTSPGAYALTSSVGVTGPGSASVTGLATTVTKSGSKVSAGITYSLSVTATLNNTAQGIELLGTRSGNVTDTGTGSFGTTWNDQTFVEFQRVFSVTGGSVNWTGSLAANTLNVFDTYFEIYALDPTTGAANASPVFSYIGVAGGSFSSTLGEGNYSIYAMAFVNQGYTNVSVASFNYVPAPGALALLGAAGLVGARRRRA